MAAPAAGRSPDHPCTRHSPRQTARGPFFRRAFFGDHGSRCTGSAGSRTSSSPAHSRARGKQCAKSESVDSAGTHNPPAGRGGTPRTEARGCRAGRSRHGPAGVEPARHRRDHRRRGECAVVHADGAPGGVTGEQPAGNGPGQAGLVPPVPDLTCARGAPAAHAFRTTDRVSAPDTAVSRGAVWSRSPETSRHLNGPQQTGHPPSHLGRLSRLMPSDAGVSRHMPSGVGVSRHLTSGTLKICAPIPAGHHLRSRVT